MSGMTNMTNMTGSVRAARALSAARPRWPIMDKRDAHAKPNEHMLPRRAARLAPLACLTLCLLLWAFGTDNALAASFNNTLHGSQSMSARQAGQSATYQSTQAGQPKEASGGVGAGSAQAAQQDSIFKVKDIKDIPWRIRILDAVAVSGPMVTLGEIAVPVGEMPAELWRELSGRALWAAPEESGRPMSLTRPRLQQAMLGSMGQDFASLCLYPPGLVIQRGGKVLGPAEVQEITVKTLTPYLAGLPGEAALSDFRLPGTVFMAHANQRLELEVPKDITAGRLSLKFAVRELDGSVVRRLTGTVFVDCWVSIPCAATTLNRDEVLEPGKITFMRKNLAQVREQVWDGKGGPWRLTRAVAVEQPILVSDLTYLPTVSKGRTLSLVYQAPTVRLAVKAEALTDGVKGESIPVRNLSSNRQVHATIIDENTVVIESGFSRATAATSGYGNAGGL